MSIPTLYRERTRLPDDFLPGKWDVLCGRGTSYRNHWGNRQLRAFVNQHLDQYISAETRIDKTNIVNSITESIRETNCRFVHYDESVQHWYEIGDQLAREKIGHTIRDANIAKKKKAALQAKTIDIVHASQAQFQDLLRTQQRLFYESLIEDQQRNNTNLVVVDEREDALFRRQQQIFQESLHQEAKTEHRAHKRARLTLDEGW